MRLLSLLLLGWSTLAAVAAGVKISDLALSTSPSTNTFLEIADLNASGTNKSAKILYTNLVTKSQFNNLTGGLIMSGTPTVGDIATAADTTGTNGLFARLSLSFTNGYVLPWTGSTNTSAVFVRPTANTIEKSIVLQPASGLDEGSGAVYVTSTDPTAWSPLILSNLFGVNLVTGGQSEFVTDSQQGSMTLVGGGDNCPGIYWLTVGGTLENPTPIQANDFLMLLAGYGLSATNGGDGFARGGHIAFRRDGAFNAANGIPTLFEVETVGNDATYHPARRFEILPDGDTSIKTGKLTARDGFASTATDAAVAISATGWTNSFGKAAVARFDGTAMTYVVYNNAGSSVYTNSTALGHATEIVQSGGKIIITAGSGVTGAASPF